MRRALALARRGWGRTAPNPMVGAVVVRDGRVVGEGWHAHYGGPHAEVAALHAAGAKARGATVYVTLEPCAHLGKVPPCTDALIAAGVRRVVCATRDPNPVAARGAAKLRRAGIAVEFGLEEDGARELNAPFFAAHERPGQPWVVLKLALSADGAVAERGRARVKLTGPRADREVHRMRAGVDAIAIGIGTAVADDPMLTVRHGRKPRIPPVRVVFDHRARIARRLLLVATAREVPTVVIAARPGQRSEHSLFRNGVEVLRARGIRSSLQVLASHGVHSVLVEGGPTLARAFLRARAVDRIVIFQSPRRLGAGALAAFDDASLLDRYRVVARRRFGPDMMTTYDPRLPRD
ncbi:MAG: bifunctional diaminohydroxyphosphoribosylaminopyrimidine deaminase/5-amino-6-(5-phosphoribosylamino)uracil reductase RibD [Gemmatimonadaceae bacterium]|nr:bifunctional diaminohydroxyphosphoribosylaminopyrimidine deaminase/5-amino-6-(5-phosphoribosylamino)uracil reductase RibD [Gemmatimonadaceae bacterium]